VKLPKEESDEEVLREGRRLTLQETWREMAKLLVQKADKAAGRELEERKMKLRCSLSVGGYVQLVRLIGHTEADIMVMFSNGLLREGDGGSVEIWCNDKQARHEGMKMLLEEAHHVRGLCDTSVFLVVPSLDVAVLVCHADALPVTSLEDKVRQACGLASAHPLILEHMYGGKVEGKTLFEAGLKIGDSVRVLL
jgi:hypothetical protein